VTDLLPPPAPERDTEGALARLVEVLLDKGVYLDLDLLISVAEVPLIAVNLRATIAGVETMIAYGIPGVWTDAERERLAARPQPAAVAAPEPHEVPARLEEPRATGPVWREGALVADGAGVLRWYGTGDRRPALLLEPGDVLGMDEERTDGGPVLVVRTPSGDRRLAADPGAATDALRAALREAGGAR
jgi:hypothetical protein